MCVLTVASKAESVDYGKISYIFKTCLMYLANDNALGQLANQSTLAFSVGGAL